MFRSKRVLFATAVALVALFVAVSPTSADDARWYLASSVGESSYRASVAGGLWRFDSDDRSAAIVAGFALNHYLAFEAGYHDLGRFDGSGSVCPRGQVCIEVLAPVVAEISGLSLSAVPRYPISDRFVVYAKVGVIDWTTDIEHRTNRFGSGRIDSLDGQDLLAAVGARYDFRSGFGLAVEHQELDFDVQSTVFGLSYRFGSY